MISASRLPLLAVALLGCGKPTDRAREEAPTTPPFAGPVTVERILAAKDVVTYEEPWARVLPELEGLLGKPTTVDAAKGTHTWAIVEGDTCAFVRYSVDGGVVLGIQGPQSGNIYRPFMDRTDCLTAAGKPDPTDDPSSPGPPPDGATTPEDVKRLAVLARSKWHAKRIKVSGKVELVGRAYLEIGGVVCWVSNEDRALEGRTVTVEGTVQVKANLSEPTGLFYEPELVDCTVTAR